MGGARGRREEGNGRLCGGLGWIGQVWNIKHSKQGDPGMLKDTQFHWGQGTELEGYDALQRVELGGTDHGSRHDILS